MASIWQHPESQYYFACFRSSDGERKKISTKSTDPDEAQRIADRWELEARDEKAKRKEAASPDGINDTLRRAMQLAQQGRLDPSAAWELVNDMQRAAGNAPLNRSTTSAWFETWRKSKAKAVKDRSRLKYEQVSRDWLSFLSHKADKPLELVSKVDAVGFRDKLAGDGLAARTVNQTIKLVRCIYSEAVEQGHLGRNPFAGVDRVRAQDAERREPFTLEEVNCLIAAADGDWRGMILVAATTGARLMDAARLTWGAVNHAKRELHFTASKTGRNQSLPLHPAFADWLTEQQRGIGKAPLFPSLAHKSGTGKSGLSMAFRKIMKKAAVDSGTMREGKGRGRSVSRKSFHSFRHFIASQLAQAGVRQEIAQQITGHRDDETHAGYVTPDMGAMRSAIGTIQLTA